MTVLRGERVTLRPAVADDIPALVVIRSTPQVHARWGGDDLTDELRDDLADDDLHLVMHQYERGPDGTWHDGLLMELLRSSTGDAPRGRRAAPGPVRRS